MSQLPSDLPFGFVETDIPRHRGRTLIGFAVFLIIVIVLAVVADNVARGYVAKLVDSKVRSSLSIPAATPVHVTVGGFSVLLQAATGKFQHIDVAIDTLKVGDFAGKAMLAATGVPINTSKPISGAKVVFTADQAQLQTLLAGLTSVPIKSVVVADGTVKVGTQITALGIVVPIAISFVPSVVDGQLALTPKSLVLNKATLTPAALRKTFGAIVDPLLATQKICVAKYLPKALPLQSITVSGSSLRFAVAGTSVVLSSALLATKGVCA